MPVSEATYLQLVREADDQQWELHCGRLVEKPGMTASHNFLATYLAHDLISQLDLRQYQVRVNAGRARRSAERYYVPDVIVIPAALVRPLLGRADGLETYSDPLPLVVEVWSPSTGDYDVTGKLPEYQGRGDAEIWLLHPYDRTLTAWRRQPDGTYAETVYQGGTVEPVALPGVRIDLDALFASAGGA